MPLFLCSFNALDIVVLPLGSRHRRIDVPPRGIELDFADHARRDGSWRERLRRDERVKPSSIDHA